jgi:hypothetical protein
MSANMYMEGKINYNYNYNMHTVCGTVLGTSSTTIRNYADSDAQTETGGNFQRSHATLQLNCMTQVIIQPQTLHSQSVRLVTAVMYRLTVLTHSFVYGMGVQPAGIIHNNLAGNTHPLLFFHVRPANQPTVSGVDVCHKKLGRPSFTETRVVRHQSYVSVHTAPFHS